MTSKFEILVVEDDNLICDYVSALLQAAGYGVTVAASGPAALQLLAAGPRPDLLFTDVHLTGGMTGIDLATNARLMFPDLKILFTSGYIGSTEREQLPPGAEFLPKPYRRKDCIDKASSLLGG